MIIIQKLHIYFEIVVFTWNNRRIGYNNITKNHTCFLWRIIALYSIWIKGRKISKGAPLKWIKRTRDKSFELLNAKLFWLNMKRDVSKFIITCKV